MHKNLLNLLAFMIMFCFSATCSAFTETLREVSATHDELLSLGGLYANLYKIQYNKNKSES